MFTTISEGDGARAGLAAGLASYALGVPLTEVCAATRRDKRAARARQVAMYLAHVGFGMSLARVAAAFQRDRSTVSHACHLVEDLRESADFDAWIDSLEDAVRAAPPPSVESPRAEVVHHAAR